MQVYFPFVNRELKKMRFQNEIILDTEAIIEKARQAIATLKKRSINLDVKQALISLENTLLNSIVLFYTHRTIWSQTIFWNNYATSENQNIFADSLYNEMIKLTLTHIYSDLYFEIESALYKYLSLTGNKIKRSECNLLDLYKKLDKKLIINYDEIEKGLKCLRNVRNSFHGNLGKYIFSYEDEEIIFKNEIYIFKKGEPTSASYKFLRDFIPSITEVYHTLYSDNNVFKK